MIHVVDYSDENYRDHVQTTIETIADLDAGHIPMLMVYNKVDLCEEREPGRAADGLYISAKEDASIDLLVETILEKVYGDYIIADFLIPYEKGNLTAYLMEHAQIIEQDYRAEGTYLKASCHRADLGKLSAYRVLD